MANRDLTLSMKLYADTARFVSGLVSGERGVRSFTSGVKREFEVLKGALTSVEGKLASIGVSVGAVATIMQSARLDKSLSQIGQTAGASVKDVADLRRELFRMSADTGQNVEDLQQGFNNAVQSGLKFREALPVIDATNKAMAVTGANADSLTSALTVASSAFGFDLSKPETAVDLLDKMTVAGRLGNAELQNLSGIFARVAVNAQSAGMGFEQTLAFIEGLSQVERQPERLATLADSTLRLFTNANYMKDAARATGVRFFDKSGKQRDPMAIMADLKKEFDKLGSDRDRTLFMNKAFGKADLDTIKGLRTFFGTDIMGKVSGDFSQNIKDASGTIERDLPQAISNAVDQTGRLKTVLRTAADEFAQPINDAIQRAIKYGLDKKEQGGMGLDGKEIAGGAAAAVVTAYLAKRFGGKLLGGAASVGQGVAVGKALESAAGVMPVFVVNMPGSGISGIPDLPGAVKNIPKAGGAAAATRFGGVGSFALGSAPLLAMYGVRNWVNDTSHDKERVESLMKVSRFAGSIFGNGVATDTSKPFQYPAQSFNADENRAALKLALENAAKVTGKLDGTLNIKIDQDGHASVASVKTSQPGMRINVHSGPTMAVNN